MAAAAQDPLDALEAAVRSNPGDYAAHEALVLQLRAAGQSDRARLAWERFSERFPLPVHLWRLRINDEVERGDPDAALRVASSAVRDYLDVPLLVYRARLAQQVAGEDAARAAFEEAVAAAGSHFTEGGSVWQAYRDFEESRLDAANDGAGGGDEGDKDGGAEDARQLDRIRELFARQLSVPLADVGATWTALQEFEEDCESEPDAALRAQVGQLMSAVRERAPLELALETAREEAAEARAAAQVPEEAAVGTPPTAAERTAWESYLAFETRQRGRQQPAAVEVLYERAIARHFLDQALWLAYADFAARHSQDPGREADVLRRATRNLPSSGALWLALLRAHERAGRPGSELEALAAQVCSEHPLGDAEDRLRLWLAVCEHRRRAEPDDAAGRERCFRAARAAGWSDPASPLVLDLYTEWADLEAGRGRVDAARALLQTLLELQRTRPAAWLASVALELKWGDPRRACQLARQLVEAHPADRHLRQYADQWLNLERRHGTLRSLEGAEATVQQRLVEVAAAAYAAAAAAAAAAAVDNTAAAAAAAAAAAPQLSDRQAAGDATTRRTGKRRRGDEADRDSGAGDNVAGSISGGASAAEGDQHASKRSKHQDGEDPRGKAVSESESEPQSQAATAVPGTGVLVTNLAWGTTDAELRGMLGKYGSVVRLKHPTRDGRSAGFCVASFGSENEAHACVRGVAGSTVAGRVLSAQIAATGAAASRARKATGDESRTAFVKNLPLELGVPEAEALLRKLFGPCGQVEEIRRAMDGHGRPRSLAYVQFAEQSQVDRALELNGRMIEADGARPQFVLRVRRCMVPGEGGAGPAAPAAPVAPAAASAARPAPKEPAVPQPRSRLVMMPRALIRPGGASASAGGGAQGQAATGARDNAAAAKSDVAAGPKQPAEGAAVRATGSLSNDDFRRMFLRRE